MKTPATSLFFLVLFFVSCNNCDDEYVRRPVENYELQSINCNAGQTIRYFDKNGDTLTFTSSGCFIKVIDTVLEWASEGPCSRYYMLESYSQKLHSDQEDFHISLEARYESGYERCNFKVYGSGARANFTFGGNNLDYSIHLDSIKIENKVVKDVYVFSGNLYQPYKDTLIYSKKDGILKVKVLDGLYYKYFIKVGL